VDTKIATKNNENASFADFSAQATTAFSNGVQGTLKLTVAHLLARSDSWGPIFRGRN